GGALGRRSRARAAAIRSPPEMIRLLAVGLARRARLFAVPPIIFAPFHGLPLLGPLIVRLTNSLQVDDSWTRAALDWHPPVSPETALVATARDFRARS